MSFLRSAGSRSRLRVANLSNYAVVVLNDLGTLPSGFEDSLNRYAEGRRIGICRAGTGVGAVAASAEVDDEAIETARYAGAGRSDSWWSAISTRGIRP